MIEEHVNNILEELRLAWGEEAALDLIDDLLQLRQLIVILHGIVAERDNRYNAY